MKAIIRVQLVALGKGHVMVPVRPVACALHPRNANYLKGLKAANDNNGGFKPCG